MGFDKRTSLALITTGLLVFTVLPARAQQAPNVGDQLGDWIFNCQALSATKTTCAVSQKIADAKSKQQILNLTLQKDLQSGSPYLHVILPLGVFLGTDVQGTVDNNAAFNFVWQRCAGNGCQASVALDKTQIAVLKKGKNLAIGFKVQRDSAPVSIGSSLTGMNKSMKALAIE